MSNKNEEVAEDSFQVATDELLRRGALAYSAEFEGQVKAFAAQHAPVLKDGAKSVVAVRSGSGGRFSCFATLLARDLTRAHGVLAKSIQADWFSASSPATLDWASLEQVLRDFRGGRISMMPMIDPVNGQLNALSTSFSTVNVLVVGGLTDADIVEGRSRGLFSLETAEQATDTAALFSADETMAICNSSMLGDTLLLDTGRLAAGRAIVDRVMGLLKDKDKFVVAVAGASGTGKSELAFEIICGLQARGITSRGSSLDNFYRIDPPLRKKWRLHEGVERVVGLEEVDWPSLERVLADFRSGSQSVFPLVDLSTDRVDLQRTDFRGVKVLVFDGLFAANVPGADYVVFLDIPYEKTKKAQAARGKEVMDDARKLILAAESAVVAGLKKKAHLLLDEGYVLQAVTPTA